MLLFVYISVLCELRCEKKDKLSKDKLVHAFSLSQGDTLF